MPSEQGPWAQVSERLVRGTAGGLIIGIPLLYTMEMWHIGMYLNDWWLIGFLTFTFILNLGLNHVAGFGEGHTFWSDVRASVIALGASMVVAGIILTLISAIPQGYSLAGAVGKIALAAIPVSIGFSIANSQFAGQRQGDLKEEQVKPGESEEQRKARIDITDVGITIAGAAIFVIAIAPTEEVLLITARTTGFHWAALVPFTLLLTYGMVFEANFAGPKPRKEHGLLQQPITETVLAYALSVLVALLLLYLLGRGEVFTSLSNVVGHAAVIGLPAAVGGAAGRVIV